MKGKTITIIAAFLSSVLFLPVDPATAQVTASRALIHFAAGKRPVQNVFIGNSSDKVLYVRVETKEVLNPGTGEPENLIPSTDLLASPKSFSIEGLGQRTIRLLLKAAPAEKERVFRVNFVPEERSEGQEIGVEALGKKAVIRVLTGMGLLVFADPAKPQTTIEWRREGSEIVLFNSGNAHAEISDISICSGINSNNLGEKNAGEEGSDQGLTASSCRSTPNKRLYGGQEYRISAALDAYVTFTKTRGPGGSSEGVKIEPAN